MDDKRQAARDALLDKIADLAAGGLSTEGVERLANAYAAVVQSDPPPAPASAVAARVR